MEYEALVKLEDNINSLVKQGELWKAGDIPDIHPKGWIWSKAEKEHFLIVNVGELEQSEAEAMLDEVTASVIDDQGTEIKELVARSKYKVDVQALLSELPSKSKDDVFNRDVEAQPFKNAPISKSHIEDITLRADIQQLIASKGAS